jgi:hypothetical protein
MSSILSFRVTDLCMAINAVDGTHVTPEYVKQNERVRDTLYGFLLEEAERLYKRGMSLKSLTKAVQAGGWDDNVVKWDDNGIKIVEA